MVNELDENEQEQQRQLPNIFIFLNKFIIFVAKVYAFPLSLYHVTLCRVCISFSLFFISPCQMLADFFFPPCGFRHTVASSMVAPAASDNSNLCVVVNISCFVCVCVWHYNKNNQKIYAADVVFAQCHVCIFCFHIICDMTQANSCYCCCSVAGCLMKMFHIHKKNHEYAKAGEKKEF